MPKGQIGATTLNLCEALNQLREEESINWLELVKKTGGSPSLCQNYLAYAVKMDLMERIPGIKPFRYKRKEDLVEAFRAGMFGDLFKKSSDDSKPTRSSNRLIPPEPEDEELEIDPLDVFEEMGEEDFVKLIGAYLSGKNALIGPLRADLERLESEIRYLNGQRAEADRRHTAELSELRESLREEREKNLELRTTLNKEIEQRVQLSERVKVIMVRGKAGATHKESGGNSHTPAPVKMHKKPWQRDRTTPTVVYRKKR